MRQLIIPVILVFLFLGLFIPVPREALDYLVLTNCTLGFILILSVLLVKKPLALSTFPSFLLILTLFRLVTNVTSTRQILSGIQPGSVIPLIGEVAIQGSLVIGIVIFLILTCIQLLVISKGAERVAEVSARFTLDALPGKQMSIDADVRAGLIDFAEARLKRQELQAESRFYGALDGAMKFIKGDAIIGLLITAINLIGGVVIAVTVHNLDFQSALNQYSLLTIGDGIISQLPAILNSIAAGILVTRVVNSEEFNLSQELFIQIFGQKYVQTIIVSFALLLAFLPGLPALPFIILAAICLILYFSASNFHQEIRITDEMQINDFKKIYDQKSLKIQLPESEQENLAKIKSETSREVFLQSGLLIRELDILADTKNEIKITLYDCLLKSIQYTENSKDIYKVISSELIKKSAEIVSDEVIKDLIDSQSSSEQYLHLIPEIIPVAKITRIFRMLLAEDVKPVRLNILLQVLSEHQEEKLSSRELLREVRIAHKYQISSDLQAVDKYQFVTLDPKIDLHFYQLEQQSAKINSNYIKSILEALTELEKTNSYLQTVILCSSNSRLMISDCLSALNLKIKVIAFEELSSDMNFEKVRLVKPQDQIVNQMKTQEVV